MSLFDWFRRRAPPAPESPAPAPTVEAVVTHSDPAVTEPPSELEALRRPELGPDQATAVLSGLRATALEREALTRVARAKAEGRAADALYLLAAKIHVDRGELPLAEALLAGLSSTESLMFAADLAAERGEVARALTLVERVLARDIDTAGARERHARWQRRIGGLALEAPAAVHETIITAQSPDTSLRIVGEAGRGGAGTVFEAVDDVLGRRVALKVYHRPDTERDKLEREARFAVDLAGRGVVRVFDVEPTRGVIVMEWLPMGALKRWISLADGDFLMPLERWFVPLVRATARVHARDLVHADIKPANVLFRSAEEPVLSDFGLTHATGLPVDGGSRGYLSPERLAGEPISPADDVYALGRLVEDVLDALERSASPPSPAALDAGRRLVALCLGDSRPRDASLLLRAVGSA